MENEQTPPEVRARVQSAIAASIQHDVELRGGRTARLLVAAGTIGVVGAVGATLLISGHPFGHHPSWHLAVFSAIWTGLLVVSLAIMFLEVRTPTLPLARSASVAILSLGLAGICGALCPDPHFLSWWTGTGVGARLTQTAGLVISTLCFGLVTTLAVGMVSAFVRLGDVHRPVAPLLPSTLVVVLLAPGIALQSVGNPPEVLAAWVAGAAAGAYLGVAGGTRLRMRLPSRAGR